MIWFVAVGGVVLSILVAVCFAALIEVFRNLAEIRSVLNLQDEATPLALTHVGLGVGDVGLPEQLAYEPKAIVVFLSAKCGTCLAIADAFRGGSPGTVWFVLSSSPTPERLIEVLADSAERVLVDADDEIAHRIGLNVTPTVLAVSYGEVARAHAVSSVRQVLSLIPLVVRAELYGEAAHHEPALESSP